MNKSDFLFRYTKNPVFGKMKPEDNRSQKPSLSLECNKLNPINTTNGIKSSHLDDIKTRAKETDGVLNDDFESCRSKLSKKFSPLVIKSIEQTPWVNESKIRNRGLPLNKSNPQSLIPE